MAVVRALASLRELFCSLMVFSYLLFAGKYAYAERSLQGRPSGRLGAGQALPYENSLLV